MRPSAHAARRGISLIEALVAMAVMAFGMLGVVGMQATLRTNADLSKQRTEAMRIAQERMEDLRNFSVLPTTAGAKAFADKASFGATAVTGYTTNTAYTVSGSVTPTTASPEKTLTVSVAWTDRTGAPQNVTIVSAMANIAPELAASLAVSPQGAGGTREPGGRRRGIPPQAKNFGDGTSGYRPPGQAPGTAIAWRFDNVTGVITSRCTTLELDNSTLNSGNVTCTGTQKYQAIWGFITFNTTGAAPTAANIGRPTSQVNPPAVTAEIVQTAPTTTGTECFHGTDINTPQLYREYFCAVPVDESTTPKLAWAGTLRINATSLSPLTLGTATGNRKVCRFRAGATYALANTVGPLGNQNLVLIEGPFSCDLGSPQVSWHHQP